MVGPQVAPGAFASLYMSMLSSESSLAGSSESEKPSSLSSVEDLWMRTRTAAASAGLMVFSRQAFSKAYLTKMLPFCQTRRTRPSLNQQPFECEKTRTASPELNMSEDGRVPVCICAVLSSSESETMSESENESDIILKVRFKMNWTLK